MSYSQHPRNPRSLGLDDLVVNEVLGDNGNGALDVDLVGLDVDLGLDGGLVRGRDAGELLDLAGAGLLVQALGVARLDDGEGRVNKDLDEGEAGLVVQVAREVTVRDVGRDEGGEGERARRGEEERDLTDAADLGWEVS